MTHSTSTLLAALAAAALVSACQQLPFGHRSADFTFKLEKVTRVGPKGQAQEKGDSIRQPLDTSAQDSRYEDAQLAVRWDFAPEGIAFSITNRTSHRIRIEWNRASYTLANHPPRSVVLSGSRHDINLPQPVTALHPGESAHDYFIPKGYIEHTDEGRRRRYPLFPARSQPYESPKAFQRRVRSWQDAGIVIHLPVHTASETWQYKFHFRAQPQ